LKGYQLVIGIISETERGRAHGETRWKIRKPHAERSSDVKDTQKKAIKRAKQLAPEGDIKLKGLNGKFRKIQ
jgi:hypothetical protein